MRNLAAAKRATCESPVLITTQGKPSFVLLRIEAHHLIAEQQTLLQVMDSIPGGGDFEFDPAKLDTRLRIPDFELPLIETLAACLLARLKL